MLIPSPPRGAGTSPPERSPFEAMPSRRAHLVAGVAPENMVATSQIKRGFMNKNSYAYFHNPKHVAPGSPKLSGSTPLACGESNLPGKEHCSRPQKQEIASKMKGTLKMPARGETPRQAQEDALPLALPSA